HRRVAVGVDALGLLESGVARETQHQIASRVHVPVFGGDRRMPDPVLEPPDALVVPLVDLTLHALQWVSGQTERLLGRGTRRSHGFASYESATRAAFALSRPPDDRATAARRDALDPRLEPPLARVGRGREAVFHRTAEESGQTVGVEVLRRHPQRAV